MNLFSLSLNILNYIRKIVFEEISFLNLPIIERNQLKVTELQWSKEKDWWKCFLFYFYYLMQWRKVVRFIIQNLVLIMRKRFRTYEILPNVNEICHMFSWRYQDVVFINENLYYDWKIMQLWINNMIRYFEFKVFYTFFYYYFRMFWNTFVLSFFRYAKYEFWKSGNLQITFSKFLQTPAQGSVRSRKCTRFDRLFWVILCTSLGTVWLTKDIQNS